MRSVIWLVTVTVVVLLHGLLFAPASSFREMRRFLTHQDEIAHIGGFLAMTALAGVALSAHRIRGKSQFALVLAFAAYGGIAEVGASSLAVLGRGFQWGDLGCNVVGVLLGWLVAVAVGRGWDPGAESPGANPSGEG